ncbi:hypothetical protein BCR37DRAFT_378795 [Protomyces lactucae-debilis]|uniref:Uncharacterized protein n=1 Tax=Protomyces lactucae-debilis TaxID=2754530 RepID=A0A1Y2FIN2_PROLT|nr:uncharacterized protein BCR37DRAFT_378795 [Protomyces lactucae-debilis]ORY83799.1 hypothetical protein BCR37DRAFT_378795 [Protomyces lactucae-debilis]
MAARWHEVCLSLAARGRLVRSWPAHRHDPDNPVRRAPGPLLFQGLGGKCNGATLLEILSILKSKVNALPCAYEGTIQLFCHMLVVAATVCSCCKSLRMITTAMLSHASAYEACKYVSFRRSCWPSCCNESC